MKRVFVGTVPLQALWRTALCLILIAVLILALHMIGGFTQATEPFIDMSPSIAERATGLSTSLHARLRFAVSTMVSAEETFSTYRRLIERIARDVGLEGGLVMRPSYEQVRLKLEWGEVEIALVCTGTYLHSLGSNSIKLLVQPELEDGESYRSLIIVPADSNIQSWEDLRDKVVAFTDHESFTGCMLPSMMLMDYGQVPDMFFDRIVYTSSDDRSILAVSTKAVDAAAVDSLVLVSNVHQNPLLKERVRVLWESKAYGPPPIVVPRGLDAGLEQALKRALLALDEDEEGRKILSAMGIKRFVTAQPQAYASAVDLYRRYQGRRRTH